LVHTWLAFSSSSLAELFEKVRRCGRPFLLKAPGQRHRVAQNKAHVRPSVIKSLILRPPNDKPRLASISPEMA
jgi:hypothetical protein